MSLKKLNEKVEEVREKVRYLVNELNLTELFKMVYLFHELYHNYEVVLVLNEFDIDTLYQRY